MNDIEELEERVTTLKRHIKNYEENDCLTDVYQQLVKECRAIENLLKERQSDKERIKNLEEENTKLKSNHIFTHTEISDEEKAKLYDVIDSSIDKFIENY